MKLVEVFLRVVDMTCTGAIVILIICLARLCIRKAPKKYSYLLWAAAAFRLVCPVSIMWYPSALAVSPAQTVEVSGTSSRLSYVPPMVNTAIKAGNALTGGVTLDAFRPWNVVLLAAAAVWAAGIVVLLSAAVISSINTAHRLKTAVRLKDNVYQSESVQSPFVFGIFSPKIYVPYGLSETELECVLCHESCHIKRGDHIVKLAAFLILTLHWFDPFVWLAFNLMSKDMEASCDERAVKILGEEKVKAYGYALLSLAEKRRFPLPEPIAFGETNIKERVKNIMNDKKLKIGAVIAVAAACIVVIIVCVLNPAVSNVAVIGGADGPTEVIVSNGHHNEEHSGKHHNSASSSVAPAALYEGDNIVIYEDEFEQRKKLHMEGTDMSEAAAEEYVLNALAWEKALAHLALSDGFTLTDDEYRACAEEQHHYYEAFSDKDKATMDKYIKDHYHMTAEEYYDSLCDNPDFRRQMLCDQYLDHLHHEFEHEHGKTAVWDTYLEGYKKQVIENEHLHRAHE